MSPQWHRISGTVQPGYRVASGTSDRSPYPKGTIEMQMPFFRELGLDLSPYFLGTLNVAIAPFRFEMKLPKYTFRKIRWAEGFDPEDFSFSPCRVIHQNQLHNGLIYYPHPETKIGHFQDPSTLEIIAEPIPELSYGDRIIIEIDLNQITLTQTKA